jgi:hypothetical protein
MPITIVCRGCDKRFQVDDKFAGKRVRCPSCEAIVSAPAGDEEGAPERVADRPERRPAARPFGEEGGEGEDRPRRRQEDEYEGDRPRRSSRSEEEDEYGDDRRGRPSRRRNYDEDDDRDDDRPRRRDGEGGQGMAITSMVLGIAGIAVCLVGCCCFPGGSLGGTLLGAVAVILGFVARAQGSRSGMGLTGIINGFVAVVLGVVLFILVMLGLFANAALNNGGGGPGPNRPGIQRGPGPGPAPGPNRPGGGGRRR